MVARGLGPPRSPSAASLEPGRQGASASCRAFRPHTVGRAAQRAPGLERFSPLPDALQPPVDRHLLPSGSGLRS